MKFSFAVIAAAIMAVQAVALPAAESEAVEKPPVAAEAVQAAAATLPPNHACPRGRAVPFLRSWNIGISDHFYTTNATELSVATASLGYVAEGNAGRVFPAGGRQDNALIDIHRLWSDYFKDHFYTWNTQEVQNYVRNYRYTYEGVAARVFRQQICNSIPLYRLYNYKAVDHFYTTNRAEADGAQAFGWQYEGIIGYVLPDKKN